MSDTTSNEATPTPTPNGVHVTRDSWTSHCEHEGCRELLELGKVGRREVWTHTVMDDSSEWKDGEYAYHRHGVDVGHDPVVGHSTAYRILKDMYSGKRAKGELIIICMGSSRSGMQRTYKVVLPYHYEVGGKESVSSVTLWGWEFAGIGRPNMNDHTWKVQGFGSDVRMDIEKVMGMEPNSLLVREV